MANITVEVEPQPKSVAAKRMCPLRNPVLLDVFTEIIADSSNQDTPSSMASELEKYLNDPLIDYKTENPYNLWGQHCKEFPTLSTLARRFLSAPATSIPSERQPLETYTMRRGTGYYLIYLKSCYSYRIISAWLENHMNINKSLHLTIIMVTLQT